MLRHNLCVLKWLMAFSTVFMLCTIVQPHGTALASHGHVTRLTVTDQATLKAQWYKARLFESRWITAGVTRDELLPTGSALGQFFTQRVEYGTELRVWAGMIHGYSRL